MPSRRAELLAGVKSVLPILLGVVPFGLISGIAAVEAGVPNWLAVGMASIIFAGASQLAAVQLISVGASPLVIVLTVWVINLRMIMYSASLGPHFKRLSTRWKSLLAYLLTDQAYVVSLLSFEAAPGRTHGHWYYLGAAASLWGTWQVTTVMGVILGARAPDSWSLDFAIPLTFIAITAPAVKNWASVAAAVMAGLVAVLAVDFPFNLGLIVAALVGVLAGVLFDKRDGEADQ